DRGAVRGRLVAVGRDFGAVVTGHEDIDEAAAADADGVHLPSAGNVAAARSRLPRGLIGASAHSADEAAALLRAGADYVTVSPIFLTASKPDYGPVLGLQGLACIVAGAPGPVVALGGITAQNAALCLSAGARGVAMMGEVMRSADPRADVEHIVSMVRYPKGLTILGEQNKVNRN